MSAAAESVIGGILLTGRDAYWRVADVLRPEDFPTPFLANAFRACAEVAKSAADIDTVTVADEMDRAGHGADAFQLFGLVSATPSAANIRGYADVVKGDSISR